MIIVAVSATLIWVVYFLAYYRPRDFRLGHALMIFFLGFLAMGATESAREMLRKPYVIAGFMYSNGVRESRVSDLNQNGFLTHSLWTPGQGMGPNEEGHRMFLGQCLPCHTLDGYRGLKGLLKGRNENAIGNFLDILHEHKVNSHYVKFMPPLVGTPSEISALKAYLNEQVNGETIQTANIR